MKRKQVLIVLMAGVLAVAATAPVAMRVEVEPLRQVAANTEVAIIIEIAPMDRGRIGSNAIIRIELDEGRVSSGSPMRAVRAGDDGSFRVVVEWPPGKHDLRVVIEDPEREDTGLWVGTVRIPDLSKAVAVQESVEPKSAPAPDPEVLESPMVEAPPASDQIEPLKGGTSPEPALEKQESSAIGSEPEPPARPAAEAEPVVEEPVAKASAAAAATAAAAAAITEAAPSIPPGEPEIAPEPEPEPIATMVEEAPEPEFEAIEPNAVEAEPEVADATALEPEPVPVPEPESAEPALVEPLRAEPPAEATVPEAVTPSGPAEQPPAAAPVSADLVALYEDWERADPETREFSVVVMRGRDPVEELGVGDVRLRVGGAEVPVERLGDADSAPLLLGIAIDVLSNDIDGWSGTGGSLAPIAERASGGRGRLFVANPSGVGEWDADPDSARRGVEPQPSMDVARLIVASLERFEGGRGRTFLVVLTDGRNEPTKDEWQRANEAAGAAGVPILVVALWDEDFSQRTRKNLKKLTVISGGSLFLVQGRSQLDSAADRFGRFLDGGYAVRFRMPSAAQGVQTAISMSAADRDITVSAPKSIR
jgi:hypothetical protein